MTRRTAWLPQIRCSREAREDFERRAAAEDLELSEFIRSFPERYDEMRLLLRRVSHQLDRLEERERQM